MPADVTSVNPPLPLPKWSVQLLGCERTALDYWIKWPGLFSRCFLTRIKERERRKEMFFFTTLLMDHFSHLISVFLGRKDKFLEIFLSTSDIGVNIVYRNRRRSFIFFLSSLNLSIRLLYIHSKMEGVNKIFCLFY